MELISTGSGNAHVRILKKKKKSNSKKFILDVSAEINEESLRTTSVYDKILKKLDLYKTFKKEKPVPQSKADKSAYKASD